MSRPPKRLQLKATRLIPVRPSIPPPYVPCNPSILLTTEGYLVNCRGVDIRRRRSRRRGGEDEVVIRSRNVLMRFSRELELLDQYPMVIDEPPLRDTSIRGLEDCRLFEVDGAMYFLCATADRHPSGHIHLSVCQLERDGRVSAHRPLVGVFDDRPQKNWLPFVGADGGVRAIYGYAPLTVLRLDVRAGRYEVDVQVRHRRRAKTWRGSAGPVSIPDSDRRLMLVHDVIIRNRPGGRSERTYLHRFIECDAAFSLTRVSRPFVFMEEGIEFACGMTLSHNGANLMIGVGIQDKRAYLCQVSLAEVERMLGRPNRVASDEQP